MPTDAPHPDRSNDDATDAARAPTFRASTELQYLRGVGPARARLLGRMGLRTVGDLLRHFPRTYDDRTTLLAIKELRAETDATVRGTVQSVRVRETSGGRVVVTAIVEDGTAALTVEFWQQRFRAEQMAVGREVIVTGRVTFDRGPKMTGPEVETHVEDDDGARLHADRIVPIHPLTKGLHATTLRALVWRALGAADDLIEPIPPRFLAAHNFASAADAVREIHFPTSMASLELAKRRFKYEELFVLQAGILRRRMRRVLEEKPFVIPVSDAVDERIRRRFPFKLTDAQNRAIADIRADIAAPRPMHRLLQGDVGSGKTAVAAYTMLAFVAARMQAALLAPTEILAEQHVSTLTRLLDGSKVKIALLSGRGRAKEREATRRAVAKGEIDLVIGTHAILEEAVRFARLGLVVVDEQHKFGVLQRAAFRRKGWNPDVLVMSATPIPRTLTMTLFGDLDVTIIDELPPGRSPVSTVLSGEGDRAAAYDWVRREIARGRRVFHVVPLVEQSEELPLKSAVAFAQELREGAFRGTAVGLLHGRMKPKDKDAAMTAFRTGATPVLVCTSVVEVGVDVPEATVMLVEHAERFGLAQLHQLRGRVGRGSLPSRVILFHDAKSVQAKERLQALCDTTDGFKIAEEDLRIRGPGEFLGTRQHGLPELRVADLVTDARLLDAARRDAAALLKLDPGLAGEGATTLQAMRTWFGPALASLDA